MRPERLRTKHIKHFPVTLGLWILESSYYHLVALEKCLVCLVAGDHPLARLSPTGNRGGVRLGLPDSEHLCIARRAGTLHRWSPVLEDDLLGIFDLDLLSALHAVGLSHDNPPYASRNLRAHGEPRALTRIIPR